MTKVRLPHCLVPHFFFTFVCLFGFSPAVRVLWFSSQRPTRFLSASPTRSPCHVLSLLCRCRHGVGDTSCVAFPVHDGLAFRCHIDSVPHWRVSHGPWPEWSTCQRWSGNHVPVDAESATQRHVRSCAVFVLPLLLPPPPPLLPSAPFLHSSSVYSYFQLVLTDMSSRVPFAGPTVRFQPTEAAWLALHLGVLDTPTHSETMAVTLPARGSEAHPTRARSATPRQTQADCGSTT